MRDPVRMTGDLGMELDHLMRSPKANRKSGKARPHPGNYCGYWAGDSVDFYFARRLVYFNENNTFFITALCRQCQR